jgi:hypothetical protein
MKCLQEAEFEELHLLWRGGKGEKDEVRLARGSYCNGRGDINAISQTTIFKQQQT